VEKYASRLIWIVCIGFVLLVLTRGWTGDDAFISFRVIDNAVNGHGLRWNPIERVQVFTNPLWTLAQIPFHAIFGNPWLLSILLSYGCSLAAIFLLIGIGDRQDAVLFFLLPLCFSRAFLDYTSSGLENPLSYLLFAWFVRVLLAPESTRFWFYLALVPGLALMTRLDTALLYAPVILILVATRFRTMRPRQIALGVLPLAAWFLFSLIYYGSLFPNTKDAKLNTGLPAGEVIAQGFRYLADFCVTDTVGVLIILVSCGLALIRISRARTEETIYNAGLMLGVVAYLAYTVRVGGDFMSGRFFSLPILVSAWVGFRSWRPSFQSYRFAVLAAALVAAKLVSLSLTPGWRSSLPLLSAHGIVDERVFYQRAFGLFPPGEWRPRWRPEPLDGVTANRVEAMIASGTPMLHGAVGHFGYEAGPNAMIIDQLALTEPVLAQLPTSSRHRWRVGHYPRRFPRGYVDAFPSGKASEMDPSMAALVQEVQLITRGQLFSRARWSAIASRHRGGFGKYVAAYHERVSFDGLLAHQTTFGGRANRILLHQETWPSDPDPVPETDWTEGEHWRLPWVSASGDFGSILHLKSVRDQTWRLTAHPISGEPVPVTRSLRAGETRELEAGDLFPGLVPGGFAVEIEGQGWAGWRTDDLALIEENPLPPLRALDAPANRVVLPYLPSRDDLTVVVVFTHSGPDASVIKVRLTGEDGSEMHEELIRAEPNRPTIRISDRWAPHLRGNLSLVAEADASLTALAVIMRPGYHPTLAPAGPL